MLSKDQSRLEGKGEGKGMVVVKRKPMRGVSCHGTAKNSSVIAVT